MKQSFLIVKNPFESQDLLDNYWSSVHMLEKLRKVHPTNKFLTPKTEMITLFGLSYCQIFSTKLDGNCFSKLEENFSDRMKWQFDLAINSTEKKNSQRD